ncbi:MAG TPA: thiamine pyrophosphate-binding protein, partial [Burkholderiales bacterium]|nr:thiamine pyrophosphate-binding protein [Burkholderiales bacterium]
MAEALVRFLTNQELDGVPLFAGVWAIFGHGNVAGLGPALHAARRKLPTLRAHNEQAMAHAAIAFAKAHARRRMMACTTSIGPGASNMLTAAALAHVNRLPVLLLPGDVFASRRPDPVLQQLENFGDPGASVNDCFRPVSRYFDRITRPEQILVSLPAALRVLLDPADCGPVTLALPQDVQTEVYDYPAEFFRRRVHRIKKPLPDAGEMEAVSKFLRGSRKPLVIAGGGVKYALAEKRLAQFAQTHGVPVAETQAGKGALAWDHPCNVGAIGVTGSRAANALAARADLVVAIGTRLGDFATGSRALFPKAKLVQLNVGAFDAGKHGALPLVADADAGLEALGRALEGWRAPAVWSAEAARLARRWNSEVERITAPGRGKPTDAQVLRMV